MSHIRSSVVVIDAAVLKLKEVEELGSRSKFRTQRTLLHAAFVDNKQQTRKIPLHCELVDQNTMTPQKAVFRGESTSSNLSEKSDKSPVWGDEMGATSDQLFFVTSYR